MLVKKWFFRSLYLTWDLRTVESAITWRFGIPGWGTMRRSSNSRVPDLLAATAHTFCVVGVGFPDTARQRLPNSLKISSIQKGLNPKGARSQDDAQSGASPLQLARAPFLVGPQKFCRSFWNETVDLVGNVY